MTTAMARDHGGALDAAIAKYGGARGDWLDLSTGINPVPYPVGAIPSDVWTTLPDRAANDRLINAARAFWQVPDGADIIAAPGASALIARMPSLSNQIGAYIPGPTYNEHAAAFRSAAMLGAGDDPNAPVHVYVHPNNPDGRLWPATQMSGRPLTIIDESFCDVTPDQSHITLTDRAGVIVLKSFGKFWGLAGLRLGFAIAASGTLNPPTDVAGRDKETAQHRGLIDQLGPWPVSGPALEIAALALADIEWASASRARLSRDTARLDALFAPHGQIVGGTDLFRLYQVNDATAWQDRLAQHRIWSRVFPYSGTWLRLGLPAPHRWSQLENAL